jgi:glucose-6-phosphate-specific signal transduction histidine kinase
MLKPLKLKAKKKPALVDKSFKVPVDVILSLEDLAPEFGSNGRAIQVGTELLVSMRRKPKVAENSSPVTSQTYSITPRTLELIERLLPSYEKHGTVLKAVAQVLQELL